MISSNKHLEEIATSHLKYLLLLVLCAAAQETIHGERHQRLVRLQGVVDDLRLFFQSMDRLSLLSSADRAYVLNDADETVDIRSALRGRAETRQEKIERFRAER